MILKTVNITSYVNNNFPRTLLWRNVVVIHEKVDCQILILFWKSQHADLLNFVSVRTIKEGSFHAA
jgi:hypothetical protein